jgi:PKD repeat protein
LKTLTFANYLKKANKHVALFFLLSLAGFIVKGQIQANFIATPTAGCAPLVVQFTDSSAGNPTQWKWALVNGTTTVLQNHSFSYFNPVTKTVS